MNLRVAAVLILSVLAGISLPAAAEQVRFPQENWSPEILRAIETGPSFLARDFDTGIAPPPENDSDETRGEIAALLKMQDSERTPEQVALILKENNSGGSVLNAFIDGQDSIAAKPEAISLILDVVSEVQFFTLREKQKYQRARPTQLEPKLTTVVPVPPHAAYPSGHSSQFYSIALVLGEVDPANREKYEKTAIDIAHRREIAGIHYPSDTMAGRQLAKSVVAAMMETEQVKKKIDDIKRGFGSN